MNKISVPKYLVIPGARGTRKFELLLQLIAFFGILYLAKVSGFLFIDQNLPGMSMITHQPNQRLVALVDKQTRFSPTQADFMPNPPSDTGLVLKRKIRAIESVSFEYLTLKLLYCPEENSCDKTCVNFRKPETKASWCSTEDQREQTVFSNIETLNLVFTSTFAVDTPEVLSEKKFI